MRAVIQRVSRASVEINNEIKGKIGQGLVVLIGIEEGDTQEDITWLSQKIIKMRIFPDDKKAMNISVQDIDGEVMIISQFTLHASTKKGNRPSFIRAAKPEISKPLYEQFVTSFSKQFKKPVATGEFGADMKVSLINDGPVSIIIDSKQKE